MRERLTDLIRRMSRYGGMIEAQDPTSWATHREAAALDDPTMVPELLDAYGTTDDPLRRRMIVSALGGVAKNSPEGSGLEALLSIVSQERDFYALSEALGQVRDLAKGEGVDLRPLYAMFSARNRHVRGMAILALERSRSPEAERRILEHLGRAPTEDDRFACVAALMSLGTEASLPALRDALDSKRKDVRFAASEAIAIIDERKPG